MTEITTHTLADDLPQPIVRKLRRLVLRARGVIVLRGLLAVAAVATASLLGAMAIDAGVVIFSAWPRWVLSLSALAATAAAAGWFLVRPLVRTFTLAGIARAIESRHPEFQERISSAIELLLSPDSSDLRGSSVLIAALAQEACNDANALRVRREVTLRSLRPFLIAAAALAVVLGAIFAAWPRAAEFALARVIAPQQDRPNVYGYQLTVTPGDVVLAVGDSLQVEVEAANPVVRGAEFRRANSGGGDTVSDMAPLPPRRDDWPRFAFTCPPASESFQYRIHAGDAVSGYFNVRVVPRPVVQKIDLLYEFPAYTRRGPAMQADAPGDIHALAGSTVTVTAYTNTPVTEAGLFVDDQLAAPGEIADAPGGSTCTFKLLLTRKTQGQWTIHLTKRVDKYEFTNTTDPHKIDAAPDAKPIARIVSPEEATLKLKPTDELPITYAIGDDFGVAAAELLVEVDGHKQTPTTLPVSSADDKPLRAAVGKTVLDLGLLGAASARQITFQVRVLDNLPPELEGPQEGLSQLFTIRLDEKAFAYDQQIVLAEEVAIHDVLQQVLKELREAKKDSSGLRKVLRDLAEKKSLDAAGALSEGNGEKIARTCKHLQTADGDIRGVLPRLAGGTFASVLDRLTDLADNHIDKAQNLCGQVKLSDDAKARGELADEADFQVDRSIALVEEMLKDLQVLAQTALRAQELAALAQQQQELADAKDAMSGQQPEPTSRPASQPASQPATGPAIAASQPASQPALAAAAPATPDAQPMSEKEWAKQQANVIAQLGQLVQQSPQAMATEMSRAQQKVKDLAAEARRLADQQTALADSTKSLLPVAELDKKMQALATEQEALAKRASADPQAARQAPPMTAAADDLKAGRAAEAVAKQASAATALAQKAESLNRVRATSDLARAAQQLASSQQAIAQQAADAQQDRQAAQAGADSAAKAAQQSQQQAAKLQSQLQGDLPALRKRQQDLAAQAAAVEQAVGANPALSDPAKALKPSAAMTAAADNMTGDKIAQAQASAAKAAQQSDQLASRAATDQAAALKAPPAAADKALAAAQEKVLQASRAAEAAVVSGQQSKEKVAAAAAKADAAASKAADAKTNAQTAKAAADAATAANASDAPAKQTAAQEAQKSAEAFAQDAAKAKAVSEAAKANSDAFDQAAKDARNQQADAQKQLKDLKKSQADQADNAQAAKKIAAQARDLADAQKKLAGDLDRLAASASPDQVALNNQTADQLLKDQARFAQKAQDAGERLAQLAKPQQDLQDQAAELIKSASSALPAAQEATSANNPSAAMQQAQKNLQARQGDLAAIATSQAAQKADQLARALRQVDANSSPAARAAADQTDLALRTKAAARAQQQADAARQQAAAALQGAQQARDANAPDRSSREAAAQEATQRAAQAAQAADEAQTLVAAAAAKARDDANAFPANVLAGARAADGAAAAAKQARDELARAQAQKDLAERQLRQATASADANQRGAAKATERAAAQGARAERAAQQALSGANRQLDAAAENALATAEKIVAADNRQGADSAAKAAELAKAQEDLRNRTAELATERKKLNDAIKDQQVAALKAEQESIARRAAALSDQTQTLAPQEDRIDTRAARAAATAADEIGAAGKVPSAASAAKQSGDMLSELAHRMGAAVAAPNAPSPAGDAVAAKASKKSEPDQVAAELPAKSAAAKREQLAKDVADLAARQNQAAAQMSALAENRMTDVLLPRQQKVATETNDLADDVGLVRMYADDLIPEKTARQDANEALTQMERAVMAQKQAAAAMAAAAPAAAETHQRSSAGALGSAAQSLDHLGQKMADLAKNAPAEPNQQDDVAGHLPDVLEAAEDALRTQDPRDAKMAAKMLAELAKAAGQQAQEAGIESKEAAAPQQNSSEQPPEGYQPNSMRGAGAMQVEGLAAELDSTGLTVSQWGLLPGELRDEILQAASAEGPEEYRQLIKHYFAELTRRGLSPQGPAPAGKDSKKP